MNLKTLREKKALSQIQLSRLIEIDNAMVSRFEKYHCLPTPPTFKRICEVLGADPEEIYTKEEANLFNSLKCPTRREKRQEGTNPYKLTVRLSGDFAKGFNEKLALCGYSSKTEWVRHCLKNLDRQYKRKAALLHEQRERQTNNTN